MSDEPMTEAEIRELIERTSRAVAEEVVTEVVSRVVKESVKEAVTEATKETVSQTLLTFGLSVHEPLKVQADMRHLRGWREAVETAKQKSLMSAVVVITTGIIGLIWLAVSGKG